MPPKIKVVKPSIGADNVPEFVKRFVAMVESGAFDSHLDLLYMAVDERIRVFHGNRPDSEEVTKKIGQVRKLRGLDFEPEIGTRYRVLGERNRGVEVLYLGEAQETYEGGNRKARVEIVLKGESKMEPGSFVKMPMAALMEIPAVKETNPTAAGLDPITQIQKI